MSAYTVPDVPTIRLPTIRLPTIRLPITCADNGTDNVTDNVTDILAEMDACVAEYTAANDAADPANTEIDYDFSLVARRDIAAGEPLFRHYGADYWWLHMYHANTHPLVRLHCLCRLHIIFVHKGKVYTGNNSRNAETMLAYLGLGPDSSYIAELGLARATDTAKINRLIAMII